MSDTNVHRVVGNLLVGTSHFFVDTTTNRVGVNTSSPSASLDIASGDLKVGSGITIGNSGTITATAFDGDGSLLQNINSDSGSWVNGASSNIHLAVSTNKVGIGTVDPSNSLHIYKAAGEGTSGLLIEKASGDAGTKAALFFGVNNTNENPGVAKAAIFYERNLVNGRGDIKFCNDAANDANPVTTEAVDTRMIIKNNGDVGMGTVTPQTTLHVHSSDDSTGTGDAFVGGLVGNTANRKPTECLRLQGQWRSTGSGALLRFTNYHGGGTNPNTYEYNTAGIAGFDYDNNWGGGLVLYTALGTAGGGDLKPRMIINNYGHTEIIGHRAFDGSTILQLRNDATQYGRTQLKLIGRYEAGNDAWSAGGARNAIMFQSQSSQGSAITNQWTIQSFPNGTSNDLGFMSGSNDAPRLIIRGNGFAEFYPDATIPLKVTNQGTATDTYNFVLNGPRPGTSGGGATHFINGSTRSHDGGTNTYTIRNDSGQLRLGSGSYTTIFEGNHLRMTQGDNSYFHFGPNGTWSGELYVGATPDKSTSAFKAQCISTNGNLHLDAGDGRETYKNYYSGSITRVNNVLRMEGCVTEWLNVGGRLTHRYTTNTYSWGRWNGPHHFDLYSNTNFTQYNGSVNTVPFYINYYSHAPIKTANFAVISSDDRLKVNEKYIENATQTLLKLKPQNYDKLACLEKDRVKGEEVWFKKESGLMTQDVYYDAPELRHLVLLPQDAEVPDEKPYVDDDPQKDPDYSMWGSEPAGLQYQGFIPYLIKSNQEIYEELQTKADMATLQAVIEQNKKLEARLAFLESALIS